MQIFSGFFRTEEVFLNNFKPIFAIFLNYGIKVTENYMVDELLVMKFKGKINAMKGMRKQAEQDAAILNNKTLRCFPAPHQSFATLSFTTDLESNAYKLQVKLAELGIDYEGGSHNTRLTQPLRPENLEALQAFFKAEGWLVPNNQMDNSSSFFASEEKPRFSLKTAIPCVLL